MKKDNLMTVDTTNSKGKIQRTRRMRLIGGKPIPGTRVTLQGDSFGSNHAVFFLRAVCLKTGTLLCEPV